MRATPRIPAYEARRGLALIAVLGLFALVAGLVAMLTLYTGQLGLVNQSRTTDVQLRQMIDSGAACARLHGFTWPEGGGPVTLDATGLTHGDRTPGGDRTAEITLQPCLDGNGAVTSIQVTATLHLPRNRSRSQTVRVPPPADYNVTELTDRQRP